ncbi:MAG: DUF4302 domain-containing protein [Ekhidna sp.]|nr:DUF4302 domain-containing protein [Ekhidna sp.]
MKKIIQHYFSQKCMAFMLVLVFIVTACSEDDSVQRLFDDTTAERIQADISKLRNTLLDSEFGWVASYRPSKETGYFRFLFKFEEDGTVKTWSNFDEYLFGDEDAGRSSVSEFEIVQGSTTKLSFTTEGLIHRLSDSDFSPLPGRENGGSGLKGDFEFLYFGKSDNGDTLTFRANRTQPDKNTQFIVKFIRAVSESESSLSADPIDDIKNIQNVTLALGSAFLELTYGPEDGGEQLKARADFDERLRTFTMRRLIKEEDTTYLEDEYVAGMDYLSGNRIRIDSLRLSENELFRDVILQYNSSTVSFKSTEINGESDSGISIESTTIPLVGDHWDIINPEKTERLLFIYLRRDIGGLTTPKFNAIYQNYRRRSFNLYTSFTYQDGSTNKEFLFCSGGAVGGGNLNYQLEYSVGSDRNRLIFLAKGLLGPSQPIDPSGQPFLDLLTDSEGFYVENLGRYTQLPFDVYTLISISDPTIRMGFFHFSP